MPIFSQNVDQIKIKIKNLIPPGAEHFVRFKKNAVLTKKLMTNFVLKVLKNEVPLFILVTSVVS